jgi:tripartite-type tricarboxylate transporter receptor subunit TctC
MRFIKTITALTVSLAASVSFAQAYPVKPIKLIVPFAPGGSTDIVARIMASKLSPILGQPVIVENRAGAGGSIGAAEIAKAAPDGYTIGMGSVSTMGTNIVAYKNNKLDPMTQFTHITNIASVPGVIFVNKNFPFKDYKSFVEELKKNPGKHSYASSGAGAVGHLAMELFLVEIGGDAQHIAYKGATYRSCGTTCRPRYKTSRQAISFHLESLIRNARPPCPTCQRLPSWVCPTTKPTPGLDS